MNGEQIVDDANLEPIADVVSLEEEQIISEEIAQMSGDIDDAFNDAQRTIEVSDSLENAADIAEAIETATPAETQLLEVIGEAAGAGSTVDPTDIVPSMEGYKGGKIAVEGIRETAARIWENIKRIVKQIWEKIQKFFYNAFGMIPSLRRRIAAMQERVDSLSGHTAQEKNFKVKVGIQRLLVNGKPITNGAGLKKGLEDIRKVSASVYGPLAENVAAVGSKLASAVARFEPAKAEATLKDAIDVVVDFGNKGKAATHTTKSTNRFKGFAAYESENLMGDVVVVSKLFTDAKADTALLHAADAVSKSGVVLAESANTAKQPTSVDFSTMSLEESNAVLADALSVLDVLESFRRGSKRSAIEKAEKDLDTASSKASTALMTAKLASGVNHLPGSLGSDMKDNYAKNIGPAVPYYRALVNMNLAYARWAQQPFGPLFRVATDAVKTSLVLVQASLAQYK